MKFLMLVIAVCEVVRAAQNHRQNKYLDWQRKASENAINDATEAFKASLIKTDIELFNQIMKELEGENEG